MAEDKKQAARADNYFFGDSLMFRPAVKMQASLVPELAELGAWAAKRETAEKAHAARVFPPRLSLRADAAAGGVLQFDIHPAYHGLLTRARHSGLAAPFYDGPPEAAPAEHWARACRFILMAQAECAPAQEMAQTAAAYGVLARENAALAAALRPWLASRIHDPSPRFYRAKQSIALSFAAEDNSAAPCRAERAGNETDLAEADAFAAAAGRAPLYALYGEKLNVLAPLSDGFIVIAADQGAARLFFAPSFLAAGQGNKIAFQPALPGFAAEELSPAAPRCALRFCGSLAFRLGEEGQGEEQAARALNAARDALLADYAALGAGSARNALRQCLRGNAGRAGAAANLRRRVLADAALDAAAAEILTLRLAEARDKAADNAREAAVAAALTPALGFWLHRLLPQLLMNAAQLSGQNLAAPAGALCPGGGNAPLFPAFYGADGLSAAGNAAALPLLTRLRAALAAHEGAFAAAAAAELEALPRPAAEGAKQILALAAGKAETNENAAFLLADRLIYSFAAAAFYAAECWPVAEAYTESRLGGSRQAGYGDFGLRHNADFILEALYPNL